ncbi:hypothetical protein ACO0K9_02270 [Undibacterium sp. Ji50W]|uniref:hypothetical protein n=1 Tax=Undibacterium sp. Ji50W TaxID=3413041 RepID=UPI003BF2A9AE
MSDNWLQYVPCDHLYQPDPDAAKKAEERLYAFVPEAEEVTSTYLQEPDLFHPGANWSGVNCPECGTDAESWWKDAVQLASESNFRLLQCHAPCCHKPVSLNHMHFAWPAAFGSFVLKAMNPNIKGLAQTQIKELQDILECELREIALHI